MIRPADQGGPQTCSCSRRPAWTAQGRHSPGAQGAEATQEGCWYPEGRQDGWAWDWYGAANQAGDERRQWPSRWAYFFRRVRASCRHPTRLSPYVDFVLIFVGYTESEPFVEPMRGIDFHHTKGDGLPAVCGFLDECIHNAAADPLPLEAPVQIKLPGEDGIVYERGL
jgi:hypothetical protein